MARYRTDTKIGQFQNDIFDQLDYLSDVHGLTDKEAVLATLVVMADWADDALHKTQGREEAGE